MWAILTTALAALVSLGALIHSSGAGTGALRYLTPAEKQERAVLALARDVVQAVTLARAENPGENLALRSRPVSMPNLALEGRVDLFGTLSSVAGGSHRWVPAQRAGAGAPLPAMAPGVDVEDRNAYEVGIVRCDDVRALSTGDALRTLLPCPVTYSVSQNQARYLVLIKAGWLGAGKPTPLYNAEELRLRLAAEFGSVNTLRMESWRSSTSPSLPIDTLVLAL